MRVPRLAGGLAFVALATFAATLPGLLRDEQFPHEKHANLFPVCTGCHVGVEENDSARFYPAQANCTGCHDGVREDRVVYEPPRPGGPTMLDFDHVEHFAEAADDNLGCEDCHTRVDEPRMAVRRASARRCLACHEHEAPEHVVVADCARCHVPFAQSGLEPSLALALPVPDPHRDPDFLLSIHADSARARPERCATCHVRERCLSCHVDTRQSVVASIPAYGDDRLALPAEARAMPEPPSHALPDFVARVHGDSALTRPQACATCHVRDNCTTCHVDARHPAIAAMPEGAGTRVVLPSGAARYPEPASHRDPDWLEAHGPDARAMPSDCSTCHTRQSCETCHRGSRPAMLAALPNARTSHAPGAIVERVAPASHGTPEFRREHGPVAATQPQSCTTCHVRVECESCHFAPDRMPYHPANFESRHASAAYGRELECSSCHSTEAFCRDCHAQLGMRSQGRLGSGFHDAQPLWLLRHGQAARQTLESCTTCHEQRDCMQCHSEVGSFQVSPHGPDFDAERARDRNSRICAACHISDPLGEP